MNGFILNLSFFDLLFSTQQDMLNQEGLELVQSFLLCCSAQPHSHSALEVNTYDDRNDDKWAAVLIEKLLWGM